jgi:hypothetical protein
MFRTSYIRNQDIRQLVFWPNRRNAGMSQLAILTYSSAACARSRVSGEDASSSDAFSQASVVAPPDSPDFGNLHISTSTDF